MFENAKMWDRYKTKDGRLCYFWFRVPNEDLYFMTLQGAHPGILVDSDGRNRMAEGPYADEYRETRKSYVFGIEVAGRWADE